MDLALQEKIAIVGGASQGIGFAIARLLALEGAHVAIVARRKDALDDAARRISIDTGRPVITVAADIRRAEDCTRIVDTVIGECGRVDILVNNDGAPPLGLLEEFDDTAWDKAVQQNLMSVVRLSRLVIPGMRERRFGRIVNITALSTLQPIARFGLSVSTWAGVIGFAKTLSLETATDRITVNTICPGRIATGRLAKVFGTNASVQDDAEMLARITREIPMGRIGDPDEIAGLVAFLASGFAGYITGSTFHVDGGRRASLL
ncbi:MAG TPA: SDR family oxidoreductase [Casimicrobiaceae bacterium]|nr:SDR family oxidoreductase [Casimicrobiaceae bacterium]